MQVQFRSRFRIAETSPALTNACAFFLNKEVLDAVPLDHTCGAAESGHGESITCPA
jgi:hypothetical protein